MPFFAHYNSTPSAIIFLSFNRGCREGCMPAAQVRSAPRPRHLQRGHYPTARLISTHFGTDEKKKKKTKTYNNTPTPSPDQPTQYTTDAAAGRWQSRARQPRRRARWTRRARERRLARGVRSGAAAAGVGVGGAGGRGGIGGGRGGTLCVFLVVVQGLAVCDSCVCVCDRVSRCVEVRLAGGTRGRE